jgi:hypothetical protein
MHAGFWWGNLRKRYHWEYPGRRRWEDNIKIDFQEEGWGMDWIDLAQDWDRWWALLNSVMNISVP